MLGWTTSFQHSPTVSQAVVVSGIAILIRLCQLLWEERFSENPPSGLLPVSSGQIMNRAYPWLKKLQLTLLLAATSSTLSALLFPSSQAVSLLSTSFLFLLASQILDRTVFFTTATSPRMPGMQ
jgi:DMSO reductase anchor subunit